MEDKQVPQAVTLSINWHTQLTHDALSDLYYDHKIHHWDGIPENVHIPEVWDQVVASSLIVEDLGMPGSGKSTFLDRFMSEDHGLPSIFNASEVSETAKELARFPFLTELMKQFPNADIHDLAFIANRMESSLGTSEESAENRLYREILKWKSWEEINAYADAMERDKLIPSPIIWQRGIVDSIVFARALLVAGKFDRVPPRWMTDMNAFLMNDQRRKDLNKGRMHAVVLHLVDPEVALARKDPSGIINLEFLKILYDQYLRFYSEYLSRANEASVALIVMNSNKGSIEENYERFKERLLLLIKYSGIQGSANKFLKRHHGWPGVRPSQFDMIDGE